MSKNYLSENQKNMVRQWISEGLSNQQIVMRASEQKPPFKLTVQNVDRNYRKPIKPKLKRLATKRQEAAINRGFAIMDNRIAALDELAKKLLWYIDNGEDWQDESKTILTQNYETSEVKKKFVPELYRELRGVLDDIAKEKGERRGKIDVTAEVRMQTIDDLIDQLYGKEAGR